MSSTTPPATDPAPEPRPLQFTLRSMFVVTIALAVLLGLVMQFSCFGVPAFVAFAWAAVGIYKRAWYAIPAVGLAILLVLLMFGFLEINESLRCDYCQRNLKRIGIALHNYHDRHGCFPPAYIADEDGKPMHSWRVLLLPFIEGSALYGQYRFDEPWDGLNNRKLHDSMPNIFRCPSKTDTSMTSYVAVVGPGTAWPGSESTKLADFSDGTSDTIMIVEVANSGIHWMAPRDPSMSQMDMEINGKRTRAISSMHRRGACVLFADGSARFLSDDLPPETVKAMLTIDGGEEVLPDDWR